MRAFCIGRQLGEDGHPLGRGRELVVVQHLHLGAEEQPLDRQADVAADASGDDVVVAGEDLHGDAVLAERPRCAGAAVSFGRVEEGNEPGQDEVALVRDAVRGSLCDRRRE